ncbi:hypothetical protein DH2020_027437 [Rehmannia glutinosa]|uniref:HMG box domain-containing protein n=1 Tax=Rehmannia glutinosa TaxID=99300 RepID=A0ABR0VY98_REHGL
MEKNILIRIDEAAKSYKSRLKPPIFPIPNPAHDRRKIEGWFEESRQQVSDVFVVLAVKKQTKKEKKAAKDPNKPKRPSSAFFVFMFLTDDVHNCREDFRKQYKEMHPKNKSVAAEKAPFVAKAEKRKEEYERKMEAYNRKLAGGGDDESDKSKSEVNDDEDEEGSGEACLET